MSPNKLEKTIIEAVQNLHIPEPGPDYEVKLKLQFLKKATQTRRKRTFFRAVKYSGALAVTFLIGMFLYANDGFTINSIESLLSPTNKDSAQAPMGIALTQKAFKEPFTEHINWTTFNQELRDGYKYLTTENDAFSLFIDSSKKKIIMVKDQHAIILYKSNSLLTQMNLYPFPTQPDSYYLFIRELDTATNQNSENMTILVYEINSNGAVKEIGDIPQAGYYGSHKIEWSPSGERAFITFDNADGYWVGGMIDREKGSYKALYGSVTKEPREPGIKVSSHDPWRASWVDEFKVLFYDSQSQSFYQLFVDEERTVEVKANIPKFPKDSYRISTIHPVKEKPRYTIVEAGVPLYDLSYYGDQRTYLLDIEKQSFEQINFDLNPKSEQYDQLFMRELSEGQVLLGSVYPSAQDEYTLVIGTYHTESQKYSSTYTQKFDYPVYIDRKNLKISPNGWHAALKVYGWPSGQGIEIICFFDIQTGEELYPPSISNDYVHTLEWVDDDTIQINNEVINSKNL